MGNFHFGAPLSSELQKTEDHTLLSYPIGEKAQKLHIYCTNPMEAVLGIKGFSARADEMIFNAVDVFNLEIPHELELSEPIHSTVAR
jgi:hypothetical protein